MSSVTATITARWNGGQRPGPPTFGVLHDAETPLEAGYARAIGNMFATTATQKSATYMVDPVDTVQLLDESLIPWHVGNANPRSIGVEQSGYARFTEADWSTAAALQQEERVAQLMREIRERHGIGLYWMTDQQLRDAHAGRIVGGWATHDQCSQVIGGSDHTDPAPNYPLARLMARANSTVQEDDMADPAVLALLQQIARDAAGGARDAAETRRLSGLAAGYPGAVNDAEVRLTQFTADVKEIQRLAGLPVGWPGAVPSEAVALGKLWGGAAPEVDEQAIIAGLAPLLTARTASLSDADIKQLVKALADEQDRRERDGDPTTGPTS